MSRKALTVSVCALLLHLAVASAQVSSPGRTDGPERIAILQPIYNYQGKSAGSQTDAEGAAFVIGGVVIAGGSSSSTPDAVSAPDENARRVIPRLVSDAKSKLRWPMIIEDYEKTVSAQDALLGPVGTSQKVLRFRHYRELATKLGVRYIATYVVQELSGYVADRGGFGERTTGRCRIDLVVYDANCNEFVWQSNVIDTSKRGGVSSRKTRMDQSLYNALRKTLEPFVLKGERKQVTRQASGLLATIKQVTPDGKTAVLDLGSQAGVMVGDEFISLDQKSRIRVEMVLQNGSTAVVVSGVCAAGDILRSAE